MISKILQAMIENKVDFCFQHQAKFNYYNIALKDVKGRSHELTCKRVEDAEEYLKLFYGHLLNNVTTPLPPHPMLNLPKPSGLPRPF